jgi:hypothetical protein
MTPHLGFAGSCANAAEEKNQIIAAAEQTINAFLTIVFMLFLHQSCSFNEYFFEPKFKRAPPNPDRGLSPTLQRTVRRFGLDSKNISFLIDH